MTSPKNASENDTLPRSNVDEAKVVFDDNVTCDGLGTERVTSKPIVIPKQRRAFPGLDVVPECPEDDIMASEGSDSDTINDDDDDDDGDKTNEESIATQHARDNENDNDESGSGNDDEDNDGDDDDDSGKLNGTVTFVEPIVLKAR